jgi:hypothetical protein
MSTVGSGDLRRASAGWHHDGAEEMGTGTGKEEMVVVARGGEGEEWRRRHGARRRWWRLGSGSGTAAARTPQLQQHAIQMAATRCSAPTTPRILAHLAAAGVHAGELARARGPLPHRRRRPAAAATPPCSVLGRGTAPPPSFAPLAGAAATAPAVAGNRTSSSPASPHRPPRRSAVGLPRLPNKKVTERRKGEKMGKREMTWTDMWGPRGSHADSAAT